MNDPFHAHLVILIEELKSLIKKTSTDDIIKFSYITSQMIKNNTGGFKYQFTSPEQKLNYLLGLVLSTSEPKTPIDHGIKEFETTAGLLNNIFRAYVFMFLPNVDESLSSEEQTRKKKTGEVVMHAYLKYFTEGLLANYEQVRDRVRRYLSPFDEQLKASLGISATDALIIADYLLQKKYSTTKLNGLRRAFGDELAEAYWNCFTIKRGDHQSSFTYLDDENDFNNKPFIEIDTNTAVLPLLGNCLYTSILYCMEGSLKHNDKYLRFRGKSLESEVEESFRKLFKDAASYYTGVYETDDNHNEHDLIILWESTLLVIEIKAKPPREPFRDQERAYIRIKRAFKGDSGIQKAYEQADRIRKRLSSAEKIALYDKKGDMVVSLNSDDIENVYCICVTRDDYGSLAADLSLLLEKAESDPYPWAVNVFDLENIIDAWDYFNWGPERLCEYLSDRSQLHGKITPGDELEVVGSFIRHGSLKSLLETPANANILLDPTYSDVFDEIYWAKRGKGPPVVYAPTEPNIGDIKEEFSKFMSERKESSVQQPYIAKSNKIGPNKPCPCGSGLKYKKCCRK